MHRSPSLPLAGFSARLSPPVAVLWALVLAVVGAVGSRADAQFLITEVFNNPPGDSDVGFEAFEILGPPNASLSGWWLVCIDGNVSVAPYPGVVRVRVNLNGMSTGSNGLLLVRDGPTVLQPPPAAETAIAVTGPFDIFGIATFAPTFLLVHGTPPTVGTDIDVNNDGTVDVWPRNAVVIDAVSSKHYLVENSREYADDFGGTALGNVGTLVDAFYRVFDCDGSVLGWAGGDVNGVNPGPYPWLASNFGWGEGGIPPLAPEQGLDLGRPNLLDGVDENRNGVPDGCEVACPADLDGDQMIDGADLGVLLLQWGGEGSADFDLSGVVDGADLGELLLAWGPCSG